MLRRRSSGNIDRMNVPVPIASVIVACIIGVFACSKARAQSPGKADPALYPKLREQALSITREKLGMSPSAAPLAVIVDIHDAKGYSYSIVAFEDGTASVYLSSGGGFIGGSQGSEAIKQAGLAMMRTAELSLGSMTVVRSHPLPDKGHTSFFVVMDDGTYSATARTEDVEGPKHPLHALYAAGQEIVTQYRLDQQK